MAMDDTGKHAAVLGLGRSGEAAARLLLANGASARKSIADSQSTTSTRPWSSSRSGVDTAATGDATFWRIVIQQ